MRTFEIYTLGCKVNHYESSQIREFLEGLGLSRVKPEEKPDLFVINTCCVTATASAKSRHYIKRAEKLNPAAKRVVCGCLATIQTGELHCPKGNGTHLVSDRNKLSAELYHLIGGPLSGDSSSTNSHKANIAKSSNIKAENRQKVNNRTDLTIPPTLPLLTNFKEQTRAFLKVQDGCDARCSYCIIPKVRPEVQNKPIEEAVSEAKALVAAGHKEIVVTGVCLGAYGRETARRTGEQVSGPRQSFAPQGCAKHQTAAGSSLRCELSVLLERLAGILGLVRIRVSSLEPGDITDELLDVFCKHPNIMPHIHLSVQSGADNVLKRMCRPYSAQELRDKISMIKGRLDRPAMTCDIIVGFPGETEEDFAETIELAKWAGFSKMHVFPFSVRAGTAAAKLKGRLPADVIKKRAEILRKLGEELGFKFREQFIGEECEVLIEDVETASGRAERYFMVYLGPLLRGQGSNFSWRAKKIRKNDCGFNKNDIAKVRIMAVTKEGAIAEEVKS
jgi:threonylcarbamoyladenosine tRNA methylthiotransferase MtaB